MPRKAKPPAPSSTASTDIVERAPADLKPWPGNPRTHSDKQVAKLKASIEAFGFTAPVLVDEAGMILSGHGRVQAAKALGLERIPTRVLSGLSETKKRAYVIADNKIAQLSDWDQPLLKAELEAILRDEFAVETTGFSTAEIDVMFHVEPVVGGDSKDDLQDEDVPAEAVSRPGDLWQLGHHRLLCGDALQPESYRALMRDERAQLVFSDPPYNVPIAGHVSVIGGKIKHREFAMAAGEMSPQQFVTFLRAAFAYTREYSREGALHFYCMDWRHVGEIEEAALPLFGPPGELCVWVKGVGGMGTFYRSQHELVFVFKRGDAPHINNIARGQPGRVRTTVWASYPSVNRVNQLLTLHPTIKPVGLVADALRDGSRREGVVLDPFAGSGTILVAAERTGRRARAIELDPRYVDVGLARWQRVTGKEATLEATGQTWSEASAERHGGGKAAAAKPGKKRPDAAGRPAGTRPGPLGNGRKR